MIFVYLFQFDIKNLHGKVINMENRTNYMNKIMVDDNCYVVKLDTDMHSTYRPIVKNNLTESSNLGPAFTGGIHITQRIVMDETPGDAPLPVSARSV